MRRVVMCTGLFLFVFAVSAKAKVYPGLKVYLGSSSTCEVTLLSAKDRGETVSVTAKSYLCDQNKNPTSYQITVDCKRVGRKGSFFVYSGRFSLVEGRNDDVADKLKVFSTPGEERPVLMSTNPDDPLFCKVEVSWEGETSTVWWWPNPFNIYYDDPSATIAAFQHIAYDAGGGNNCGRIDAWNGGDGSVGTVEGSGNPGQTWKLYVKKLDDYAEFGCFFDKDGDRTNDAIDDANDLSVYYKNGYLQFDARVATGTPPVYLKVEIEKACDANSENDVKFTRLVKINSVNWKTYRVCFEPGDDNPAEGIYHFENLEENDLKSIVGLALITLVYDGVQNSAECAVYVDNIRWARGEIGAPGVPVASIELDKDYYVGEGDTAHVTVTTSEDAGSSVYVTVKSELDPTGIVVECSKTGENKYEGDFGFIQGDSFADKIKVYAKPGATGVDVPPFTSVTASYGAASTSTVWWPNPFWIYHEEFDGVSWAAFQHMDYDVSGWWNSANIYAAGDDYTFGPDSDTKDESSESLKVTVNPGGWGGWYHQFGVGSTPEPRDMSVYEGGKIAFDYKIEAGGDVLVKIEWEGGSAGKKIVADMGGTADGSWHSITIDLNQFGSIDYSTVKIPASFWSVGSGYSFWIDNVKWEK